MVADDGQARCLDLGDRVVDFVAGEGVEVGLAVADGYVGQEACGVEESGGGADGYVSAAGKETQTRTILAC